MNGFHRGRESEMQTSSEPTSTKAPVPPHAPLTRYYEEDPKRSRYVVDLFNRTAHHYNTIEKLFFNSGLW